VYARAIALAALLALSTPHAEAQDSTVEFKLSHFMPSSHPLHKALEDWAASIEKASRLGGPASHGCIRLHPANKVWRQRLLLYPGATRSSRAVPLRRHALIAEGRALPMTNATGVIMHGGNLLTTTATGLITDGRGLPMATLTGLITADYYWRPEPRTSPFFNPY
jgi:hypothetical protein